MPYLVSAGSSVSARRTVRIRASVHCDHAARGATSWPKRRRNSVYARFTGAGSRLRSDAPAARTSIPEDEQGIVGRLFILQVKRKAIGGGGSSSAPSSS